jgi:hypothetical protein
LPVLQSNHIAARPEVDLELVSPELVLVDPELALRARERLPDRHDWTIEFEPRRTIRGAPPSRSGRPRLMATTFSLLLAAATLLAVAFLRPASPRPYFAAASQAPPRTVAPQPAANRPALVRRAVERPNKVTPRSASIAPPRPERHHSLGNRALAELTRTAINKEASWAIARLGSPTSRARESSNCRLRWEPLRLTLFVTVSALHTACRKGRVVGAALGGRGAA